MKNTFVPPSGNPNAKIAIVGEQPGIQEIQRGKPFIGPAGRGLDECLQIVRMQKQDLYLTYVIKDLDKPLKYYINLNVQNKYTISPEGYQYIQELGEELKKLNPSLIISLGNIALIALCSRIGINKWRGSVIESTLIPGIKVIPTLSPETFVPPKFNFLNKPLICSDLELARHEYEFREIKKLKRKLVIKPTFEEAKSYLEYYYTMGLTGQIIGIDIEVINGELDCISFSSNRLRAISIPFKGPKGDYFPIEQEYQLMLLIAKIIQEPEIKKAGANFIFDTQFLLRKYNIIPKGTLHCTQIAQKISLPDYPAGLDFVTNTHTDLPYYKQDGKQWMNQGAGTWEEWWNYSAIDALVPVEAIPKQLKILKDQENERTYERQNKLIKPLIYMSERGIKLNVENMILYKAEQQEKLNTLAEELNKEVGYEINYNSPKQLMEYFYGKLGIKPYKKRNAKGQYNNSIDVDALKRISRNHKIKSAQLMLDIRGLSKRISTYLNTEKIDPDGRYRSSYKPVGAETGRIASGETIFGTGGNQQNWPHDLLKFFLFDKGYIGYAFDLSQIENRIVAYVGGVIEQIKAFEQGVDLHTLTASIIANKPYHEISDEDGSSPLGDGRQSERFWGKKGNHATNYDVGYKTFALKNEMQEKDAKYTLEKIHKGYPQIRGGYHLTIQNMLRENRTVTNLFGRTRLFLGPIIPSYPNTPKNACMNTYREAYAHLAQSTCADKINEQGVNFIYYNQNLFRPIELLTQIHDSVVFQIPLSIPFEEHAKMLLKIKDSLETPLYWKGLEIKTPVDLSIGFNMYKKDMKELKGKDIPNDVELFSKKLKEIHDGLKNKKT